MTITPLIAGNWKMNGTPEFGVSLAKELSHMFHCSIVEMAIFPSFTSLYPVAEALKDSSISLGGQNLHAAPKGAHTGEVSGEMLKATGCKYVIVGHSERRHDGETNEDVSAKACAAIEAGLVPVVCIGELSKMAPEEAEEILEKQLRESLKGIAITEADEVVIAYEPVWAIGTGLVPTTDDLRETFEFLRGLVKRSYGDELGGSMRLLYGGSLNAKNAEEILAVPHINGGLIGGASLEAEGFVTIAKKAAHHSQLKSA